MSERVWQCVEMTGDTSAPAWWAGTCHLPNQQGWQVWQRSASQDPDYTAQAKQLTTKPGVCNLSEVTDTLNPGIIWSELPVAQFPPQTVVKAAEVSDTFSTTSPTTFSGQNIFSLMPWNAVLTPYQHSGQNKGVKNSMSIRENSLRCIIIFLLN